MRKLNCPICKKAGLPDYTISPTICPQCNSDLEAFFLLNSISNKKQKKVNLFALSLAVIIACTFSILYYNSISQNEHAKSENIKTVLQFQDSIRILQDENAQNKLNLQKESLEKEVVIKYKIKFGDYPSKIAEFFYNNWRMHKEIEEDNNLHQPYTLIVGHTLLIRIKKE